jgi:23S rRNA (adenine2503-C2)-methyltransferase
MNSQTFPDLDPATESVAKAQLSLEPKKRDILEFCREELARELGETLGFAPFRSRQLIQWIYRHRSKDFDSMTNIAKDARKLLSENYSIYRPKITDIQRSIDGTRKYLFELSGGDMVESVLIAQPTRYTLCISSQVGCAIGCKFCRTGLMGLKRHLTTTEIIGQVLAVKDDIAAVLENPSQLDAKYPAPKDFQNIVFMGMGEPLHNFDNVARTVRLLGDPLGLDISARKITVSTSGMVPSIKKFGEQGVEANLAVSLNATTDETRTAVIPINKKWPIPVLLQSLRELPLKRSRRITIEYVMLAGVNDTDADLKRLPALLKGIPSKVNLIPYNSNAGLGFESPSKDTVYRWQQSLLDAGLNSTIRWSKGPDIDAACGQLATVTTKKKRVASSNP